MKNLYDPNTYRYVAVKPELKKHLTGVTLSRSEKRAARLLMDICRADTYGCNYDSVLGQAETLMRIVRKRAIDQIRKESEAA